MKRPKLRYLMVAFLAVCACDAPRAQTTTDRVVLGPLWTLEGLQSPESVHLSADGAFLYVSNIGGEGDVRDGDGFISRASLDGRMLESRWATGMDAPKGMALRG